MGKACNTCCDEPISAPDGRQSTMLGMAPKKGRKIKAKASYFEADASTSAEADTYSPSLSDKSEILSSAQISQLCSQFPAYMRSSDWQLLYSMDQDGCSLHTFFHRCRKTKNTIIVC